MENCFVTITGLHHYLGIKPYKIGRIVMLVKEHENLHDPEAIRVELPFIDTIGYVANSVNTVYAGTCSAGRLYDRLDEYAYARIMFITHSSVIAVVLPRETVETDGKPLFFDIVASENDKDEQQTEHPKNKIGFY